MEFLRDIWGLLKDRKKFWLLPALIMLVAVGTLVVLGSSSAISPFIYTIF